MSISSEILVRLRKDRGWSQQKLSIISGLSERTIQRVEQDGSTCSLETKLALASVFEISPTALSPATESENSIEYIQDKSSEAGYLFLGLITLVLYLMAIPGIGITGSLILFVLPVLGLALMMAMLNYGPRSTFKLIKNSRWIIKYPKHALDLNHAIIQTQSSIQNIYVVGVVLSVIWISVDVFNVWQSLSALIVAAIFAEFWLRPYKRIMERMLLSQREN